MRRILFTLCLTISFFLHITLFLFFFIAEQRAVQKEERIEFEIVRQPPPEEEHDGKLVDQMETPLNEEVPENTDLLSKNNQTVKKETIARHHGQFKNVEKEGPELPPTKGKKVPKGVMGLIPKYKFQQQEFLDDSEKPEESAQESGQGVSQTLDDVQLKDREKGLQTLLSTREFVYHSYYSRIRNQLAQYWEPLIKHKIRKLLKKGRMIASSSDKVTKVIITLNNKGVLVKVQVVGESGVTDLDDAAIEAFREAAPFPNPPEGLIETDGRIRIPWTFILEA